MNWFDGLDGLASGVSIITISSFTLIFFVNNDYLNAWICASLIGGIVGFLKYNFLSFKNYNG